MFRKKIISISQAILFILILAALFHRAVMSVEMTDEIHGVASVLNILEGKKPFVTSWDYHTGWCLIAPFYWLYLALQGGSRDGIVLFSRILYLVIGFFILFLTSYLYCAKNKRIVISLSTPQFIYLLSVITYVPFSIFQLSYNSLTVYLLLILLVSLQAQDGVLFASGTLAGLVCVNYPPMAVTALLLFGLVWRRYGVKKALRYGLGLSLTGLLFLVWILQGNSPSLIARAFKGMLSSPHQISRGATDAGFLKVTFWEPVKTYLRRNPLICAYAIFQAAQKRFARKDGVIPLGAFILFSIYNEFLLCRNSFGGNVGAIYYAANAFLTALIWTLSESRLRFRQYALYFAGIMGFSVTYAFSSDNRNVLLGFYICAVMTAFLSMAALLDYAEKLPARRRVGWLADCVPLFALLLFSAPGLIASYQYVYRDSPVQELNAKVESGIYEGLYTSPEKAAFVVDFEHEISENIDPDKTVCVVTREPMIYVMSKAAIYAPQTWDAQFLYRGFTSAEPLLSYFEAMGGDLPDIMAATDSAIDAFYGNERYEIIPFIQNHYRLYYAKQIDGVTLWLWERSEKMT